MKSPEELLPPIPQPATEQVSEDVFQYVSTFVKPEEITEGDGGYFLPGDTVTLERTAENLDSGWIYVGVDALNFKHGIFAKMLDGHRAKKSYPFNWDKV